MRNNASVYYLTMIAIFFRLNGQQFSDLKGASTLCRMVSIDMVEKVWTCRPALLNHARSNRTQPESSWYGSKEVCPISVVWRC